MQYISDVTVRNITTRKELQQFVRDDSSVSLIKNTPCIIHFLFFPPQILSRFACMMHYGWGNLVPVHARVCVLGAGLALLAAAADEARGAISPPSLAARALEES